MLNIVLICNGGISASIMMKKILREAEASGMRIHLKAIALTNFTSFEDIDVVLLSPQVSYAYKKMQAQITSKHHIMIINNFDYSSLNAKKIVQEIRCVVEKEALNETRNS